MRHRVMAPVNRDRTDLIQRLALPETRPAAISAILAAVGDAKSPALAAASLGVSLRTLFRVLEKHPELWSRVGWPTRER